MPSSDQVARSSLQSTTILGYLVDSHLKNAGTPIYDRPERGSQGAASVNHSEKTPTIHSRRRGALRGSRPPVSEPTDTG